MLPAWKRHKGSELDTNQKLLTDQGKILHYTPVDGSPLQLTVINQVVVIDNCFGFTVNLPSVAEAAGLTFAVSVLRSGNAVVLTDFVTSGFSDSIDWGGDYILDEAGDSISLRSQDGSWIVVSNNIS